MTVIESICFHEGFSPTAYPDVLSGGKPYTFGHGLTWITKDESIMLVNNRVNAIREELNEKVKFFNQLPLPAQDVLIEMSYQLKGGVNGVLNFKNALFYLSKGDWLKAVHHFKDSLWYRQTPKRADDLMQKIITLKNKG